jgi:GTPase SAR1 family protein
MAYDYSELLQKAKSWAEQAQAAGWLSQDALNALNEFDARSPETLFNPNGSRPLIVAFMGGTGVGKSSLLNRLAGKQIAKSGIERPTSREVTLFHHHSIAIQHLPEKLPVEKIRIAQHDDEAKKNIVWIDMPDFDSTEQSNKVLVFEWLPHIDVLIYVVSPERYRDEKAWRLLLSEGSRHAWLFVLNQWDRGQQAQYEDFKLQLGKAGFVEPIIFKTVCGDQSTYPDEFAALESTIFGLANKHVVAELEQRSEQVKKLELRQQLQHYAQQLGQPKVLEQADELWENQWQHTSNQLQQGFAWPIQKLAAYYAENAANLIVNANNAAGESSNNAKLWDDWAQARFGDALDEFIVKLNQSGIPATPLKNQLAAIRSKAPKIVQSQSELQVRQALANPGNIIHRSFLKLMRFCEIVLPLATSNWVGYHVFMGYYASNNTHDHYLGVDFAVHSGLLVVISWLIPWFILKKLKPSLEKSALNGLNSGLNVAIAMIDGEIDKAITELTEQHSLQLMQLSQLSNDCGEAGNTPLEKPNANSPLSRMLIN